MVLDGLCVGGDPALAAKVGTQDARPPPVLQREAEPPSEFGLRFVEGPEAHRLRTERGPRELAIPPDPERYPVVVDLHEHDGAGLAAAGRQMLDDGQAGRMICSRHPVRKGPPTPRGPVVVGPRPRSGAGPRL